MRAYKVKSQKSKQQFLAEAWYLVKMSNPKLDIFECNFAPVQKETVEIYSASVECEVSYRVEVDTLAKVDEFLSIPQQRIDTGATTIKLWDLNSIEGDDKNRVCSILDNEKSSAIITPCDPSGYDIDGKLSLEYRVGKALEEDLKNELFSNSKSQVKVKDFRVKSYSINDTKYLSSVVYIVEKYSTTITYDGKEIEIFTYPCVKDNIFVNVDDSYAEECSDVLYCSSSVTLGRTHPLWEIHEPRIENVRDTQKEKEREKQLKLIKEMKEKTGCHILCLITAECIGGMAFFFVPGMWFVGILALAAIFPTYKFLHPDRNKKIRNAEQRQYELLLEIRDGHKTYLEGYFKSLESAFEKKLAKLKVDCDSFKEMKNDTKTPEEKAMEIKAAIEQEKSKNAAIFGL